MSKKTTWKWCSKYIRLRDALDYCDQSGVDIGQFNLVNDIPCRCCTCGRIKAWICTDAGHFISRGAGGWSGVYFDERNIHAQCKPCNAWQQGAALEYQDFMLEKYGQDVIDQLRFLHKNNSYKYKLVGLELYYKEKFQEMVTKIKGLF